MRSFNLITVYMLVLIVCARCFYDKHTKTLFFSGVEVTDIPKHEFEKNCNARILIIENTSLTSIPAHIALLEQLTTFNYKNNKLTTDFSSLISLKKIQKLGLSSNDIRIVPVCLSEMKTLKHLCLKDNQIDAFIDIILSLENLNYLDISKNNLLAIPGKIRNLTNLLHLDLSCNNLNSLPVGVSVLQNLEHLHLNGNIFKKIPIEICLLTKLKSLLLHNNFINSMIISNADINAYENAVIQKSCSVTSAYFQKISNVSLFSLKALQAHMYRNSKLCINKDQCYLVLNYNRRSIRKGLFNLRNLTVLNLANNMLTSIPKQVKNLINLKLLILSENYISSVPTALFRMKYLMTVVLIDNEFTKFPIENSFLSTKTRFYLDSNFLCKSTQQDIHLLNSEHKTNRIKLGYQYGKLIYGNNVVYNLQKDALHWNIDTLKKKASVLDIKTPISNITDRHMVIMFDKVLKYFVVDLISPPTADTPIKPQNLKTEGSFTAVTKHQYEINRIFKKEVSVMTSYEIDRVITIVTNLDIIDAKRHDEEMGHVSFSEERSLLINKIEEFLFTIRVRSSEEEDETTTTNITLNNYVKILFVTFLKNIYYARNNETALEGVCASITCLFGQTMLNCVTGQMEQLRYYYSAYCAGGNENIVGSIETPVINKIASIREQCFLNVVSGCCKGDVHNINYVRSIFYEWVGVSHNFIDPYSPDINVLSEAKQGSLLNDFFTLFTVEKVIEELVEHINGSKDTINAAFLLLKQLADKDCQNATGDKQKMYYDNYEKVTKLYFTYFVNTAIDIYIYEKINKDGVKKILLELKIIQEHCR